MKLTRCSMCPMLSRLGFCEIAWKRAENVICCPMDRIKHGIKKRREKSKDAGAL